MLKKRIASAFLCLVLCLSIPVNSALAAGGSLSNFARSKSYSPGQFSDVPASSTFSDNVSTSYELGIMQGQSQTSFGINRNITRLASLIIACRLNSIYFTGKETIETDSGSGDMQTAYLTYAQANGIYTSYSDWSAPAKRSEYALLLASALPAEALPETNTVEDGAIPDVPSSTAYASAVYHLYRSGILAGSDTKGTFHPDSYITRGEACAIATRMADLSLRKTVTLKASTELDAEQIYEKCSTAVFYLAIYDKSGSLLQSGSGFFIDSDGTAVTNYHVIDGGYSAKATTMDGKTYAVFGVYGYDKTLDIAILKVNGSGFTYLKQGAADTIKGGAAVFAIGSPLGLSNSISEGIISNTSRTVDSNTYIQITAAISPGSSGGALINKFGDVIGITSASIENGQNLNLAIPISNTSKVTKGAVVSLSSIYEADNTLQGYADCPSVPDFGAYFGVVPVSQTAFNNPTTYGYFYSLESLYLADVPYDFPTTYSNMLIAGGFKYSYTFVNAKGENVLVYIDSDAEIFVYMGIANMNGVDGYTVVIIE